MSDRLTPSPPRPQASDEERRAEPRGRCLIEGRALFPDNARTLDVTVRNLGPGGAMIQGEGLVGLPDHFLLAFPSRGYARPATLRWSSYARAGVTLDAAPVAI